MSTNLVSAYQSLPVSFTHGEGIQLWDKSGKSYLDALCGIAVTSLGHNFPAVTEAICDQASKLLHCSNLYSIEWQHKLATRICESSGMDKVFFANSGAEANEAAIKLARLYGNQNDIKNPQIIVMEHSFHGRTMATLSATGNRKVQAGFEPLVSGFVRAPYNDLESIESIAKNSKDVVAILVEPVQGEAGIIIPDAEYLTHLRTICDENNWLLMLDEIQTGIARSGKLFAFQHSENAKPDVMTLAKALGNGMPIGACVTAGQAAEVIQPGKHGTTFGGNPLACRVALTVLENMINNNYSENAKQRGEQLNAILVNALSDNSKIKEVRNLGLLFAIEMTENCQALTSIALENGLLINVTAEKVIRLLPAVNMTEEDTREIADRLLKSIDEFCKSL